MTLRKEKKVEFEREITKSPFWRTCFRRDCVSLAESYSVFTDKYNLNKKSNRKQNMSRRTVRNEKLG